MSNQSNNNISEGQVESALVTNLVYLRELLQLNEELKLVARQLRMQLGEQILDLLLLGGKNLYLIELKITPFDTDYMRQIISYRNELISLQQSNKLIQAEILPYLLVTSVNEDQIALAKQNNITVIAYAPLDVLKNYYNNLAALTPFLKIKPNDYGVFNIGLINRTLVELANGAMKQEEIASKINLAKGSIHNHLKLGLDFGLVRVRIQVLLSLSE